MAGGQSFWGRWRVRVGYPVAAACLWLAAPTPRSIALGAVVAAAGLVVRGAAAGRLRKHEALATSGPYARTRNPLYFGTVFLGVGFAVASWSPWAAALLVGYFLLFYPAVMKREEGELREHYGAAFEEYAARVPLFWPRLRRAGSAGEGFSWAIYRRNREYQALLGFLAGLALLWLRMKMRR
jgi:protein-S-isoprenylcysteine O-methyltransferase Ste14